MPNSSLVDLYHQIDRVSPDNRTETARALHDEIARLAHGRVSVDELSGIDTIRGPFRAQGVDRYSDDVALTIKVSSGSAGATKPVCSYPNCPNR